ncbi:unnamed protein product, partial [marine sediment metagenome]
SELVIGKIPEQHIFDLWNNDYTNAIRNMLYRKQRWFTPCSRCDFNGGFYLGFIKLPKIIDDEECLKIIEKGKKENEKYLHKYATKDWWCTIKKQKSLSDFKGDDK